MRTAISWPSTGVGRDFAVYGRMIQDVVVLCIVQSCLEALQEEENLEAEFVWSFQ